MLRLLIFVFVFVASIRLHGQGLQGPTLEFTNGLYALTAKSSLASLNIPGNFPDSRLFYLTGFQASWISSKFVLNTALNIGYQNLHHNSGVPRAVSGMALLRVGLPVYYSRQLSMYPLAGVGINTMQINLIPSGDGKRETINYHKAFCGTLGINSGLNIPLNTFAGGIRVVTFGLDAGYVASPRNKKWKDRYDVKVPNSVKYAQNGFYGVLKIGFGIFVLSSPGDTFSTP